MYTARLVVALAIFAACSGCNRNQQGVSCAPIKSASVVRVSQNGSGHEWAINDPYRVRDLVSFANGRRDGFSARRSLPVATTSASFFDGASLLATLSAGPNFLSLTCSGWQGVQEANRVQVAEFQRLVSEKP